MHLKSLVVSVALGAGLGAPSAHAQSAAPAAAIVTPAPSAAPAASAAVPVGADYVIGPDDVLMISVWKNETLSRTLPVRPDGKISMPLLHDVQAAGLTPMQLRDRLASSLAEFMPNPEVAVSVTEVRSYRVSVLGEVQRPGLLQLRSNTTILEALAMAGGFRDFASPSKIMIFRQDAKGNTEKLRFNYNRAVSNASEQENLLLKSGDVIVVP
jgi:polysaccharide biosynthesis/export protein